MTALRYLPCPTHRDDLMGWRFLVLDVATGETVRDGLTESAARAICSRRNGVDTAPRPYGCVNVRPGEDEPCGREPDGLAAAQPWCPACRAAAHDLLDAAVSLLTDRAA